jgi:hypothetical protein
MFYGDVFRAFDQKGIRYLVVGARAMNLHGVPRMTSDLDIVVDLHPENLDLVVQTLTELGYRSRLPVDPKQILSQETRKQWKETKGLIAFTFIHPKIQYQEVDILLESPVPFQRGEKDKKVVTLESIRIPFMSIDHLIEMKRMTGREQDQSDIEVLERIKGIHSKEKDND